MRPTTPNKTSKGDLLRWSPAGPRPRNWTVLARCSLCTVIVLAGTVVALCSAAAGSITYTWNEDDGQNVQGSFVVLGVAQVIGSITASSVVSFNFSIPNTGPTLTVLNSMSFPIPIGFGTPHGKGSLDCALEHGGT